MHYQSPEPADLNDVFALNRAWLAALDDADCDMTAERDRCLAGLTAAQRERLAAVPLLLLSFHEADNSRWLDLFDSVGRADLFATSEARGDGAARVGAAGIAYLWQLARRNPYVARIVCGAPLSWCERLASCALAELIAIVMRQPDMPALRFRDDAAMWDKLRTAAAGHDRASRRAAQLCCVHRALTRRQERAERQQRTAARTLVPAATRVTGRTARR